jgi:hypothetical protein
MNINGKWYTETETAAYIAELGNAVKTLCVRESEYKRLLKAAVEDMTGMQFGEECKVCSKKLLPNECPIHNNTSCILEKDFKWRYADEALALIGKDMNVTANVSANISTSMTDTSVGGKGGADNDA